jgi:hypothetical protein
MRRRGLGPGPSVRRIEMRKMLAAVAVVLAGTGGALAQGPPMPQPVVPPLPPPPVTETVPVPAPVATPAPAPAAEAPAPATSGVAINLLDKSDSITPGRACDGLADPEASAIGVEADGGTLSANLTGLTGAHCFIGGSSAGLLIFELTQEFDIAPESAGITSAEVTLAASLNGYLWARHKAQAAMKLADAALYDAGGNLVQSIAMPPAQVCDGCLRYQQEATAPASTLPVGRYTLVAHFTIESGAGGLVRAHGTSVFSGEEIPGLWAQSGDPFAEEDRENFGFNITVSASAITPAGQARRKSAVRPAAYQIVTPAR